jgi:hypothetical protein
VGSLSSCNKDKCTVRAGKARSRVVRSRSLSGIGLRAGRLGGSTVDGSDRVRVWDCQGAVATGHRGAQRGVVRRQAGGPEGAGCQRRRRQKGRRSTRAGQSQSEEDARRGRREENEAAPQKKGQFLLVRGRRKKKRFFHRFLLIFCRPLVNGNY